MYVKECSNLRGGVVVADVALPGVWREEQPPRHPVGQHAHVLGFLLVGGVEVEQHSLLLHRHQALVKPRPLGGSLTGLAGLDEVLAPDCHLEAAVDDLTSCPEVLQDLGVVLPSWRGQGGQEDALKYQN